MFRSSTIPTVVGPSASALAGAQLPLTWSSGDAEVTVHYMHIEGTDVWTWTYDGSVGDFIDAPDFCGGPG